MKARDFKDKDYPVPHLTEEERLAKGLQYRKRLGQISQQAEEEPLAKGQKFLRMLAQSKQQAMERKRLSTIPVQAGTDSVN